jgi:hypothetical protein
LDQSTHHHTRHHSLKEAWQIQSELGNHPQMEVVVMESVDEIEDEYFAD